MSERTGRAGFWLRWSWRDLREHWIAVVAIALVLAIGTGVYAGLSSTSTWRRVSNDASFAAGNMHDLRVATNPGTFVDEGVLADIVSGSDEAAAVQLVTERLVVANQVDVDTADGRQLVSARVVGSGLADPDTVGRVWVRDGNVPSPGSGGAVLEAKFADFHGLDDTGGLRIAGDRSVSWTGLGVAPEDFYVMGPEGSILAQADMATIYLSLGDAQQLLGRDGLVNEVVLTLAEGADRDAVEADLRARVDALADVGATVTVREDAEAHRILYEDIDNDQQFFTALAVLILFAAALAAFNLVNRIVEAQRREIGIGMALGAPRAQLAIRPMLIGLQIALLGVLLGVGIGIVVASAMRGLFESVLPLPDYRTPFQYGVFGAAAALGFAVPLAAAAWPVWRAVRVEPIDAIRTGHLTAKPGRFTRLSKRLRLPGSTLNQIPMRNVLRTPRRAALTAGGVGAAIAALVAVLGMLDSFERSIDRGSDEVTKGDPDRVLVLLDTFHDRDGAVVDRIERTPEVGHVDAGLMLPGTALDPGSGAGNDEEAFDLIIEFVDFDTAAWTPTISGDRRDAAGAPGARADEVFLAEKAASDLDVGVGDPVSIRHAVRTAAGGFSVVVADYIVAGLHPNPMRTFAFFDLAAADAIGFGDSANYLHVYPADGSSRSGMQAALFDAEGVASTNAVARISEAFDEAMETFVGFLVITSGFVLVLALLIAFNATRITVEERRRDHATMRAFGVPVRSVMATVVKESVIVGVVATVIGVAIGGWVLGWMLDSLARRTLPDFGIARHIGLETVGVAAAIGIVAVTLAPMFLVRRVRRMDLPSTLRVME